MKVCIYRSLASSNKMRNNAKQLEANLRHKRVNTILIRNYIRMVSKNYANKTIYSLNPLLDMLRINDETNI